MRLAHSFRLAQPLNQRDPALRLAALHKLQAIANDPAALRAHLLRTSMIEGLRQAQSVI